MYARRQHILQAIACFRSSAGNAALPLSAQHSPQLDNHCCFDSGFKSAAKQLLLSHHRLASDSAASSPRPGAAAQPAVSMVITPPCSPARSARAPLPPAGYGMAGATTTTRLQLSTDTALTFPAILTTTSEQPKT